SSMVMRRPRFRNASSRKRWERTSKLNSVVSKIFSSGVNVTFVPRGPLELALPRELKERLDCRLTTTPFLPARFSRSTDTEVRARPKPQLHGIQRRLCTRSYQTCHQREV